jgi:hypothetical protein
MFGETSGVWQRSGALLRVRAKPSVVLAAQEVEKVLASLSTRLRS